ncbi:MAG: branched-chain amino acid ABC transporter permease [Candidatus Altiarchaeota archaeon]|nr:branched-chain amino acid ABC transporter permease [Candidatus Altiarchaeota archaeon]
MDLAVLPEILFWGLYAGCIYILLAIGLNLIFGVMRVVNFAQGELMVLAIYITFFLHNILDLNPYLAFVLSIIVMFFVGVLIERLCFRPIMGTGKLNEIFMSLALIYLIQNALFITCDNLDFCNDINRIRSPLGYEKISFGFMELAADHVVIICVTVILVVMLYLFMKKTSTGKAMRATSQNREGAMLTGINVERMDMLAFGLGSSFAAAASLFWISEIPFTPYSGSINAIKAFAVIIVGGLGSIPGAIAGGLIYGVAENLSAYLFGGGWKHATSFIILIIVLIIRPTGLFGEREE